MQVQQPATLLLALFLAANVILFTPSSSTSGPPCAGADGVRSIENNNNDDDDDNSNNSSADDGSSGSGNVRRRRIINAQQRQQGQKQQEYRAGSILPSRLVSVVGLESSGSTFLTTTLAAAVGAQQSMGQITWTNNETGFQIQHLSLPTGFVGKRMNYTKTIPYVPPVGCCYSKNPQLQKFMPPVLPERCAAEARILDKVPVKLPMRFFVNLTSHVQWYRERGVDTTVVIIVRDYSMHRQGKLSHAPNPAVADQEDEYGMQLILEAADALLDSTTPASGYPELLLVSYETFVQLGHRYLFDIYKKLGIDSTYAPRIRDGNKKYAERFKMGRPMPSRIVSNEEYEKQLAEKKAALAARRDVVNDGSKKNKKKIEDTNDGGVPETTATG